MSAMSTGSAATREPTLVALVRHGESQANSEGRIGGHGPTPLTDLGHQQAQATAQILARDLRPTVLVSSDLLRARQTAAPLAALSGLEVAFDPRWRERSLGVMDNLPFTEIAERYPDDWRRLRARDPLACPPGGETLDQVFARVSAAIEDLVAAHPGGRVVVVSHGLAIFHALAHIFGLGSPGQGLRISGVVGNCSVSTFEHHPNGHWRFQAINDRAHLQDPGRDLGQYPG